jgi:hypothetical protein
MTSCAHRQLVLLPAEADRVRCRHCHLTIKVDDLTSRYCPECFAAKRIKYSDFDQVAAAPSDITRYRCEECGALIETR